MYPTLFTIGAFSFHSYTVLMSTAFVIGVILAVRENYKLEEPYPITTIGGLWVFLLALIGTRAWYIIQYSGDPWWTVYRALRFWEGGMVFYGGLLGGVLGAIGYLKFLRLPLLPVGDIVMPFILLAHSIARWGCFLNGCCWGSPTSMPWGVCYPKRSVGAYSQQAHDHLIKGTEAFSAPVHPTPIYESIGLMFGFFVLRWAYKRGWHQGRPGAIVFLYPIWYGILRFIVEHFRGDNLRSVGGTLTVSQVVAMLFVLTGLTGYAVLGATAWRKKTQRTEGENAVTDAEPAVEPPQA